MECLLLQLLYNIFMIREEEFGKKFKCINGIINEKNGILQWYSGSYFNSI